MAAGIVKELDSSNRSYYKVDDIVKLLDVSQSKAYNMIREMRQECIDRRTPWYLAELVIEALTQKLFSDFTIALASESKGEKPIHPTSVF